MYMHTQRRETCGDEGGGGGGNRADYLDMQSLISTVYT